MSDMDNMKAWGNITYDHWMTFHWEGGCPFVSPPEIRVKHVPLYAAELLVMEGPEQKPVKAPALIVPAAKTFDKGAGVLITSSEDEYLTSAKMMSCTLLAVSYAYIQGLISRSRLELLVNELRDLTDEFERNQKGLAE